MPPGFGGPRFQHFRDVGMIHQGQGLSLGFESRDDLPRVHAQLDDLERNLAADWFLLLRHIDHTAAAVADFFKQSVTTNSVT